MPFKVVDARGPIMTNPGLHRVHGRAGGDGQTPSTPLNIYSMGAADPNVSQEKRARRTGGDIPSKVVVVDEVDT